MDSPQRHCAHLSGGPAHRHARRHVYEGEYWGRPQRYAVHLSRGPGPTHARKMCVCGRGLRRGHTGAKPIGEDIGHRDHSLRATGQKETQPMLWAVSSRARAYILQKRHSHVANRDAPCAAHAHTLAKLLTLMRGVAAGLYTIWVCAVAATVAGQLGGLRQQAGWEFPGKWKSSRGVSGGRSKAAYWTP